MRLTTLPPSSAIVMKSGNLNFLETSGPLQACNGTALPFMPKYQKERVRKLTMTHLSLCVVWCVCVVCGVWVCVCVCVWCVCGVCLCVCVVCVCVCARARKMWGLLILEQVVRIVTTVL